MRQQLLHASRNELLNEILPWWMQHMVDPTHGGFYGRIDDHNQLHPDAPKAVILNTRILWTFSAACIIIPEAQYMQTAKRAFEYIKDHFIDAQYGGVFWRLDHTGKPAETRKQMYAQAFAIYAQAEYHRLTKDQQAKTLAIELFKCIEKYSYDPVHQGYLEALDRDWTVLADVRLSDKDANEAKSMNTHLHILEAYTNLYRIWPDALLKSRLEALIEVFLDNIAGTNSRENASQSLIQKLTPVGNPSFCKGKIFSAFPPR